MMEELINGLKLLAIFGLGITAFMSFRIAYRIYKIPSWAYEERREGNMSDKDFYAYYAPWFKRGFYK